MMNLINHPLFTSFASNPLQAWGAVAAVVGGIAFLFSQSIESMLVLITAFAFTILPAIR